MRNLWIIFIGILLVLILTALRFVLEHRPDRPVGPVIFNFFVSSWLLYCFGDFLFAILLHKQPLLEQSLLHIVMAAVPIAVSWYVLHKRSPPQ